jgi:hypothetical protein
MGNLGDIARRRGEMPFLDHLEELRWRILWSLLAVVVGTVVGFVFVYYFGVMELLMRPMRVAYADENFRLIYLSPADPFFVTLKLAVVVGILWWLGSFWPFPSSSTTSGPSSPQLWRSTRNEPSSQPFTWD